MMHASIKNLFLFSGVILCIAVFGCASIPQIVPPTDEELAAVRRSKKTVAVVEVTEEGVSY